MHQYLIVLNSRSPCTERISLLTFFPTPCTYSIAKSWIYDAMFCELLVNGSNPDLQRFIVSTLKRLLLHPCLKSRVLGLYMI